MNTDKIAERYRRLCKELHAFYAVSSEMQALLEEREAMREALRFYAEAKNYAGDFPAIFDDEGERARKALEGKP